MFNNTPFNSGVVSSQAIGYAREYHYSSSSYIGKTFINYNISITDSPALFSAVIYNEETSSAGCGFLVYDHQAKFIMAGSCWCPAASELEAELMALCFGLHCCRSGGTNIKTILASNEILVEAFKHGFFIDCWRLNWQVSAIKELFAHFGDPKMNTIPRCWNQATSSIALHGLNHHNISLFHQGMDLPKWLMNCISRFGVSC